jgi:excinuclease ABC subunit B
MYADTVTESMRKAMSEMERRRKIQMAYNSEHGITPETIVKSIDDSVWKVCNADYVPVPEVPEDIREFKNAEEIEREIRKLEKEMRKSADDLEFERAAEIRDRIGYLKKNILFS